ncbi:3-dehydroquinate dehydratase [Lishizhenia tianjinensis]|uniref:3-dehydroquinate dehydratase n=1 Tax=Lishizhenia tianjinensis TaxID=477690 RepID=A0A1I7AG19_9FLAO|nr:type II 3-dehydroquinate dehydratase [Lishizhenia tianjinensis]SFT73848.1 3-dehydroquinate dehydratase [Lishizhenia tianjinensis]
MNILIINGPNLNLLGKRKPEVYGNESFESYFDRMKVDGVALSYFQSNIEGEIIDAIQREDIDGIVLNAGAYTHTSIGIRDAIEAVDTPVVEVHISNVCNRESFRHTSYITPVCVGSILGLGLKGYDLAIEYLKS